MSVYRRLPAVLALLLLAACTAPAPPPVTSAPASPAPAVAAVSPCPLDASPMDGWNDRAPPRKIFGNTYYVGTCGIASILVVGTHGAILIDGATDKAPPAIEANIRALGFELGDVKLILNTHEHSDHAGGLAQLQRDTKAPVLARTPGAETLRRGAGDRSDPQFEELEKFPPVADVRAVVDGKTVRLGDLALLAHATPGHAPGGTSWTWRSCEGTRCLDIAYVDSHSALTDDVYRFADHPDYVAAFHNSIDLVAALPCDLLITPHPFASDLLARFNGDAPLIDADGCQRFADAARTNLAERLAGEGKDTSP